MLKIIVIIIIIVTIIIMIITIITILIWWCTGARDWHGSRFDASSGTAVSPAGPGCARL